MGRARLAPQLPVLQLRHGAAPRGGWAGDQISVLVPTGTTRVWSGDDCHHDEPESDLPVLAPHRDDWPDARLVWVGFQYPEPSPRSPRLERQISGSQSRRRANYLGSPIWHLQPRSRGGTGSLRPNEQHRYSSPGEGSVWWVRRHRTGSATRRGLAKCRSLLISCPRLEPWRRGQAFKHASAPSGVSTPPTRVGNATIVQRCWEIPRAGDARQGSQPVKPSRTPSSLHPNPRLPGANYRGTRTARDDQAGPWQPDHPPLP